MAQPLKLTAETQARIIEAVEAGNYIEVSAQYAGITKQTLYRWLQMADDPTAPDIYRDFRDALESARAKAEVRNVAIIQTAGDQSWQAAAWFLERTAYKRWGRRTQITGDGGEPIRVEVDHKDSLRKALGLDDADTPD